MKNRNFIILIVFVCFLSVFCSKAFAQDTNNTDYWKNEGSKLEKAFDYEKSLECYKKALALDPNDADCLYHIAYVLNSMERYEEAIPYLDNGLEIILSGKDTSRIPIGDIYAEKGYSFLFCGRYNEALALYDQAINSDKNWAYPWYWKAYTYYKMKNNQMALECCDTALKINPKYDDALKLKAELEK